MTDCVSVSVFRLVTTQRKVTRFLGRRECRQFFFRFFGMPNENEDREESSLTSEKHHTKEDSSVVEGKEERISAEDSLNKSDRRTYIRTTVPVYKEHTLDRICWL
jgi:hypothetical protein